MFSSKVNVIKKVVGYIAKYMTKDIDNRLFNRHRYFYSRNLIVPTTMYLALDNEKEQDFYKKIIQRFNTVSLISILVSK